VSEALVAKIVAPAVERPVVVNFSRPVDYEAAAQLQQRLVEETQEKQLKPIVLLLEHPWVVTLGRGADEAQAAHASVHVVRSHRGGNVTVHGPGQLVGYPIVRLRDFSIGVKQFVSLLETMLTEVCKTMGVTAYQRDGFIGCWTDRGKIGSIGIAVRHGISWHGWALYNKPQDDLFVGIDPCALPDVVPDCLAHYGVDADRDLLGQACVSFLFDRLGCGSPIAISVDLGLE